MPRILTRIPPRVCVGRLVSRLGGCHILPPVSEVLITLLNDSRYHLLPEDVKVQLLANDPQLYPAVLLRK